MSHATVSPLLRFALRLDAVASAATGLGLAAFATQAAALFALPHALLLGAGLFCVAYGATIGWMSARSALPRWAVLVVVVGNVLWASECLFVAFGPVLAPTAYGVALLAGQALAVYAFAALQYAGLRGTRIAA